METKFSFEVFLYENENGYKEKLQKMARVGNQLIDTDTLKQQHVRKQIQTSTRERTHRIIYP